MSILTSWDLVSIISNLLSLCVFEFTTKSLCINIFSSVDNCLLKEVKECVEKAGIPLETAISTITANPAEILSLKGKGKIQEGFDADLCVLDQGLEIQEVVARGKTVYRK